MLGSASSMKSIDIATLMDKLPDVTLFDTRPPALIAKDGLPGAKAISLEAVQLGDLPDLPKDEAIYLICQRGAISELLGLYLEEAGFKEVYNVAGGMNAYYVYKHQNANPS